MRSVWRIVIAIGDESIIIGLSNYHWSNRLNCWLTLLLLIECLDCNRSREYYSWFNLLLLESPTVIPITAPVESPTVIPIPAPFESPTVILITAPLEFPTVI